MANYTTETQKIIRNNEDGYSFIVKEDSDGLGLIEVSYSEKTDGDIDEGETVIIPFDPKMASLLCKAIQEVADTIIQRDEKVEPNIKYYRCNKCGSTYNSRNDCYKGQHCGRSDCLGWLQEIIP
jgi:hypothetical protein